MSIITDIRNILHKRKKRHLWMRVDNYRIDLHGYGETPDYYWIVQIQKKDESWMIRTIPKNPLSPDSWKKYYDTGKAINDALAAIVDIERSNSE